MHSLSVPPYVKPLARQLIGADLSGKNVDGALFVAQKIAEVEA